MALYVLKVEYILYIFVSGNRLIQGHLYLYTIAMQKINSTLFRERILGES